MAEKFVSGDFIGKHVFVNKNTPVYMSTLGKTVLFTAQPNIDIGVVKAIVRGSKQVGSKVVPADTFFFSITLSNGKLGFVKYADGDFNSFKSQGVRTDKQKGSDDKKSADDAAETTGDKISGYVFNGILLIGGIYIAKEVILKKVS